MTLSEPGAKLAIGGILGHAVSSAGKEVFSRVLAAELAASHIRVICIRPHALAPIVVHDDAQNAAHHPKIPTCTRNPDSRH
jgi:hypothetical protein